MATYAEVTEALKFFVELGGAFQVDDKGYIRYKGQDKVAQVSTKNENKDLILLQEVITDSKAQILNPFAEGLGASPDQAWFYETTEGAFTYRFVELINFVVECITNNEDINKAKLPAKVVKFISPYVKVVDKTTLKEIEQITKNFNKFSSLFYNKRLKTAVFRCAIFEGPAFRESFNVRKKTWKFLEDLLVQIFNLDPNLDHDSIFEDYRYKTEVIGYPKLDAMLNLYYKLFNQLNPIFDLVDKVQGNKPEVFSLSVDLDTFGYHISKLDEYFQKAKTIIQPSATQQPQQQSSVRNVAPNQRQHGAMPMPSPYNVAGQNYGGMPMPSGQNAPGMPMPYQNTGVPHGQMPMPYSSPYAQPQQSGVYNYPYPPNQVPTGMVPGQPNPIPGYHHPGGMPLPNSGIPTNASGIPNTGMPNYGPIGGMPNANYQMPGEPTKTGYATTTLSMNPPLIK